MNRKTKIKFAVFLVVDVALITISLWEVLHGTIHLGGFGILNPQGIIAVQERKLLFTAILLMLIVVIPVYVLLFLFASKYRADKNPERGNNEGYYTKKMQVFMWCVPASIIFVLSVINWKSTHELDPFKPIPSTNPPLTIEVVALQWKWLFIYPEQNIATVNFIEFPANTPVHFELTADAPMNLFWIPQLGGEMAAMTGMVTQLNLLANSTGDFPGQEAEINGQGYSGMKFTARAATAADFDAWVKSVKNTENILNMDTYNKLSAPSENNPATMYSSVDKNLYTTIVNKFMAPSPTSSMPGMDMQDMDMK